MRISLRDIDSKIPNLALMKISAYHKAKGDLVDFNLRNPDRVYTSIVFTKNKGQALNQRLNNGIEFLFGGSGINLNCKLPDEIEFVKPDYDLYPSIYSQGFTTRGCNRNCYFCIVPDKEGNIKQWQHPKEFYDERFDTIMLMDNNILLDRDWAVDVLNWCIDQGLKVDMTQGYDIRLIDKDIARIILRTKADMFRFAFDDTKLESIVKDKIKILKDTGFNLRNDVQFYCYCHNDSMHDDALYRCNILKELGTNAFLMYNCDLSRSTRIKNLIYWCNRKKLYWSISYEKYSKLLHT